MYTVLRHCICIARRSGIFGALVCSESVSEISKLFNLKPVKVSVFRKMMVATSHPYTIKV